ncbi:sigma-70 family RNA polymerase sigma factor [Streptomyces sp. TRM66268-LWL]|uniref:Sigma-70 family RNA polymerase sigma factor n=1 Tax=Streptomyces polyasparticus TaxID=2767826 RepID=A0ABR7STL2_9ACTN|nr:sigma-70 family RNA polymerase sigma factor [Streptomyces polyasparticus]MBC9718819.1 sigma-70 family RNA polymerase sigma factor [Streptomyces polyasparticus]
MRSTWTLVDERPWRDTVVAAQRGDRQALDALVAGWLPLVYNVVGRALDGHADVDDVVQETMLRAVHSLDSLRDPDRFRSWLVAIAVRQVRERARRREPAAAVDPGAAAAADFAELAVLRLELDGQRREVAEAVPWLDAEDRELLSLWWLEVAGELTRGELAAAAGITRGHAAVRVQRVKGRLETARGIVRALDGTCQDLARTTADWDGRADSVWRKRIARHVRGCARCGDRREPHVPAERLLAGLALVPVSAALTVSLAASGVLGGAGKASAAAASATWTAKAVAAVTKPAVAVTAGATFVAGGAYVVTQQPEPPPQRVVVTPTAQSTARPGPTPRTSKSPTPTKSSPRADRTAPPHGAYGTVVDTADRAPDPDAPPGPLPRRGDKGVTLTGFTGMTHRGETVTLTGTGYVRIRWQVVPQARAGGLVMPTWTGLKGRLFHVASGGGHRMDDRQPGDAEGDTWMTDPVNGPTVLPEGAQQMWQNEYVWIDGTVTLHQNERGADYNLYVQPSSWQAVTDDVRTREGVVRYGLVRDTGTDKAPVPQYLTRSTPADPATVAQHSRPGPPSAR